MGETIMIFGGGINQLTLIEAANELQVTSVVIDPNPDAPGKNISNYFYCIAGNDYETTKEIAINHKVSGIVTSQMEKPLRLMAKLAQEFDFIFLSPEVVEKSIDKYLMKQAFIKNDVPCAKGILFKKEEKINTDKLKILSYPLIIKPKDATSSQGVFKINHFEEIERFIDVSRSFSKNREIILEEFLNGLELSVEAITFKGKTTIVQYTEKFITPFPETVEIGHLQPASLSEKDKKEIGRVVKKAINAIGIDNSASHTEVKLTKNGPKVVEIGARLGGDFIASYLVLHSCGINMDKAAIQIALGIEPDLQPKMNNYSYIKYLELEPGKQVTKVGDWEEVMKLPGVVFTHINIKPGDIIPKITESGKRQGFIIVKGDKRSEVLDRSEEYCEFIKDQIILE